MLHSAQMQNVPRETFIPLHSQKGLKPLPLLPTLASSHSSSHMISLLSGLKLFSSAGNQKGIAHLETRI